MAFDAQPITAHGPSGSAHEGDYLCLAWGESDCPIVAITPDRQGVVAFLTAHWFGEAPETLHADSREAFDLFMAEFDSDEWDMVDHIEVKFEIGGLRVTKVVDVSKAARWAPPRPTVNPTAVQHAVADRPDEVSLALTLHPATADLVVRFARALADKLALAERKYRYSDGWRDPAAIHEMREDMIEHVGKGDPLDVAAYCAFLWHHGASTARPQDVHAQRPNGERLEGRAQ